MLWRAGARVLGASSMGALRASELDIYGMEGIGLIYQAYKSGHLVSDDEVALTFDPFTWEAAFRAAGETFASIWILAWQKGAIITSCRDTLFRCAESLYFPERTYERMMAEAIALVPERS